MELQNLHVFVGMVKGDTDIKVFHSMVKYNDMFANNNLNSSVIGFMGDRPLSGRLWVFNIPRDKPWVWPEVEYVNNSIEIQGHFGQEGNNNILWDTEGGTNKTKTKLPRFAMVTYAMFDWLVQVNRTPNLLRLWMEKQDKDDPYFQK